MSDLILLQPFPGRSISPPKHPGERLESAETQVHSSQWSRAQLCMYVTLTVFCFCLCVWVDVWLYVCCVEPYSLLQSSDSLNPVNNSTDIIYCQSEIRFSLQCCILIIHVQCGNAEFTRSKLSQWGGCFSGDSGWQGVALASWAQRLMGYGEDFLKSPKGPSHEGVLWTEPKEGVSDDKKGGFPVYNICRKGWSFFFSSSFYSDNFLRREDHSSESCTQEGLQKGNEFR